MKKRYFKQLDLSDRRAIESGLNQKLSLSHIANSIGFSVSSVRREILRNRRPDGKSGSSRREKNDCMHLSVCKVHGICANGCDSFCRSCDVVCETKCDKYEKRICRNIERAPLVCNSCTRYAFCCLDRYKYSADAADALANKRAKDSRCGNMLTASERKTLTDTVRRGLGQGQSIHHIFLSNEMPCSERTFYRYVEDGAIPVRPIELSKMVKYKRRKQRRQIHKRGFYAGHEYCDYLTLSEQDRMRTTQMDTVLGARKDKQCILSLHRVDLHFQIYALLERKTALDVVEALAWIEFCCQGYFEEIFGLILCDRGSEFDDIQQMESSFEGHGAKRCSVYFTDPSRPDQKGSAEKNHVELRKILPKGMSLDELDAYDLAEICSHVNSTIRKGCGDATPFDLAANVFPKHVFELLGLRKIPAKDVIAAPNILYRPSSN